jgi:hypothetical protein
MHGTKGKNHRLGGQIMTNEKTKQFFELFKKNQRLFEKLLKNKASEEDGKTVELCLTEIYFNSQRVIKLIDKISKTNLTKGNLNSLLSNLIDLETEIYLEMAGWIKELKNPLKDVIDKVGSLEGDKSGTDVTRKTFQSSMKQLDVHLEKMRYYTTHYKPKKKRKK